MHFLVMLFTNLRQSMKFWFVSTFLPEKEHCVIRQQIILCYPYTQGDAD